MVIKDTSSTTNAKELTIYLNVDDMKKLSDGKPVVDELEDVRYVVKVILR